MRLHHLNINKEDVVFLGPPINEGPLPAIFYYALSGLDSLTLSPFNQPIVFLKELAASVPFRIFSVTLPGHHPPLLKEKAIEWLCSSFEQGNDPLAPFLQAQIELIETLIAMEVIDSKKIILSGLSRGGLIACLVAAKQPLCHRVLAFAPLTKLSQAKEFHKIQYDPRVMQYDLSNYVSLLGSKKLRFYIGNNDRRVHTSYAFELISSCASYAFQHRLKHSSHELIIGNSIGYEGHGTAEATFKEGALWMFEELFYHE